MKNHSIRNSKTVQNPNNKGMYYCMNFWAEVRHICAVFCSYAHTHTYTMICSKNGRWQSVAKQKINEQENKYHKLSNSGINPIQHREAHIPSDWYAHTHTHTLCETDFFLSLPLARSLSQWIYILYSYTPLWSIFCCIRFGISESITQSYKYLAQIVTNANDVCIFKSFTLSFSTSLRQHTHIGDTTLSNAITSPPLYETESVWNNQIIEPVYFGLK